VQFILLLGKRIISTTNLLFEFTLSVLKFPLNFVKIVFETSNGFLLALCLNVLEILKFAVVLTQSLNSLFQIANGIVLIIDFLSHVLYIQLFLLKSR
jgi:hypothetical protein